MHTVSIQHTKSHNFTIEIDGVQAHLSYKSFGGHSAVDVLGAAGLARLLNEAEHTIHTRDFSTGFHNLFSTVGVSNAMALLELCCADAFRSYWKALLYQRKHFGQGCSFRSVLAEVSGTRATLAQNGGVFVKSLHDLCQEVMQDTSDTQPCTTVVDEANDEGIRVRFLTQTNNMLAFDLNNQSVFLCTSRTDGVKTSADVHAAAQVLRRTVISGKDLRPLVVQWGGSFVFRVLQALCPTESVEYFCNLAQEGTAERTLIAPRKMLKDFGFPFNDQQLAPFCHEILSALEQVKLDASVDLANGNHQESLSSDSKWTLFYTRNSSVFYRTLDFSQINNPALRSEAARFMRAYAYSGTEPSVTQTARYFYLLRSGLNALSKTGIVSIAGTTVAHARSMKTSLQCIHHCSTNHISEVLQALGRMFHWAVPTCDIADNPFWCIEIPNKRAYLHTTTPAKSEALRLISNHLDELPAHVQLGHRLLMLTLARAHDVFHIRISDFTFYDDDTGDLHFISSKNGYPMRFSLPQDLVPKLREYIDKTVALRESAGNDYLLLYMPDNLRAGSLYKPRLLSYTTYNYHIERLMMRYAENDHVTTRQIRAEGGRRYHSMGMSSSQVALALGNTPAVAKANYRTLTPRDEAELFHRAYTANYLMSAQNAPSPSSPQPLWGSCSSTSCQHKNHCQSCPYLYTLEVISDADLAKIS